MQKMFASDLEGSLHIQHDPSEFYNLLMEVLGSDLNNFELLSAQSVKKSDDEKIVLVLYLINF